jgi:trans-aconitate methyltransferase
MPDILKNALRNYHLYKEVLSIIGWKRYIIYKLRVPTKKIQNQKEYWNEKKHRQRVTHLSEKVKNSLTKVYLTYIHELEQLNFNNILVAGCAFGYDIKLIKEKFPEKEMIGLDFSSTQIKEAKSYLNGLNISLVNADVRDMPFEKEFDVVFTHGLLMHILPEYLEDVLLEIKKVAKKYVICIEPYIKHQNSVQKLYHATAPHFYLHNYEKEFTKLDFKIIKCYNIPNLEPRQLSLFLLKIN